MPTIGDPLGPGPFGHMIGGGGPDSANSIGTREYSYLGPGDFFFHSGANTISGP